MTQLTKISDNSLMSESSASKIVAVTVTFNIDHSFEASLQSYLLQLALVVIVDNSTETDAQNRVNAIAQAHPEQIILIQNGHNLGLAKAQNLGIRRALDEDADWVLLMDDDSSADPQMVEQLVRASQDYQTGPGTGIVVPKYLEQSVNREALFVTAPGGKYHWPRFAKVGFTGQPVLQNIFIAISSGSLIKAKLFDEIGMIRESFDIDYLDVDFCLRAIEAGYRIVAVRDAVLRHNLGEQTKHHFLGRHFFAWNHSARRRFTIYRNRTRIWREHLFRFPGFVLFDFMAALMDLFRIVMFEQQKSAKLKSVLKGVGLGLFGSGLRKQAINSSANTASD
ncbi:hypothetical protein A3195_11875 [Candidatus Thiodiazotropha endoloripes]|uniref:Glycosyltransferase 2-like domain-containing protein n=2 Tax=Candidatus Thiodiazotropha endoloripes TaxID=1818881 RepID=A0A1E2URM5_9GAMM|nr:hypothetical protein A3195_11875 [Candidatus Thiodiazotropha endoloripes]ODB88349.1 hypothetical protein A3193_05670 [Candidatus Thiodiazotropha endoloripes]ODB97438.1 hypothetical protein A3196_12115 [Candidatus Thiodiazotropha endoloripes]